MRVEVKPGLAYGDMELCPATALFSPVAAYVHIAKDPCHRRAVGYTGRSADRNSPEYYAKRDRGEIYLNVVDPDVPLFALEPFLMGLAFMDEFRGVQPIAVHCNKGESRAPSLVLLHMARRSEIPNASFPEAMRFFAERWPYSPGSGILVWLERTWSRLMEENLR